MRRAMPRATMIATLVLVTLVGVVSGKAADRRFVIAAVEPKGGVTVDVEEFPAAALPGGGGYALRAPDENNRWEVSAYVWMPSQIVVEQGDRVILDFVGINGAHHPTTISGYDKAITVHRGEVTSVRFTADKVGVFVISCDIHQPSMVGELVVFARP